MKYFHHQFDHVEEYLHHRPPYLMVDRIVSMTDDQVVTEKQITGSEFFIAGHFPGAPIVPGAMMQEMTTQSAGILIAARYNPMEQFDTSDPFFNEYALGVLVKVTRAKYRSFARPGDTLIVNVKLNEHINQVFDFSASILVEDETIMKNSFQLTNIKSKVLQGV